MSTHLIQRSHTAYHTERTENTQAFNATAEHIKCLIQQNKKQQAVQLYIQACTQKPSSVVVKQWFATGLIWSLASILRLNLGTVDNVFVVMGKAIFNTVCPIINAYPDIWVGSWMMASVDGMPTMHSSIKQSSSYANLAKSYKTLYRQQIKQKINIKTKQSFKQDFKQELQVLNSQLSKQHSYTLISFLPCVRMFSSLLITIASSIFIFKLPLSLPLSFVFVALAFAIRALACCIDNVILHKQTILHNLKHLSTEQIAQDLSKIKEQQSELWQTQASIDHTMLACILKHQIAKTHVKHAHLHAKQTPLNADKTLNVTAFLKQQTQIKNLEQQKQSLCQQLDALEALKNKPAPALKAYAHKHAHKKNLLSELILSKTKKVAYHMKASQSDAQQIYGQMVKNMGAAAALPTLPIVSNLVAEACRFDSPNLNPTENQALYSTLKVVGNLNATIANRFTSNLREKVKNILKKIKHTDNKKDFIDNESTQDNALLQTSITTPKRQIIELNHYTFWQRKHIAWHIRIKALLKSTYISSMALLTTPYYILQTLYYKQHCQALC